MTSAVLFSGGLDSAVLLASEAARAEMTWPIHVRTGMAWEPAEARAAVFDGRITDAKTITALFWAERELAGT